MYIALVVARNLGRISSIKKCVCTICHSKFLSVLFFFETGSAYVVQAITELMCSSNPLASTLNCGDSRHTPPCLATK